LGDGKLTSFWHDNWHCLGVLSTKFAVLFSHCTRQNASVLTVINEGLSLRPRLSSAAAVELEEVGQLLAGVSLGSSADSRYMAWQGNRFQLSGGVQAHGSRARPGRVGLSCVELVPPFEAEDLCLPHGNRQTKH
jgi:hypothetical protein